VFTNKIPHIQERFNAIKPEENSVSEISHHNEYLGEYFHQGMTFYYIKSYVYTN
jgi:hypothetical protein